MKILLIIALALVSYYASAQNYLGYTKPKLDEALDADEMIIKIKETVGDTMTTYEAKSKNGKKYYYTVRNNICFSFAIICTDVALINDYIKLFDKKYVRVSKSSWMDYGFGDKTVMWEIEKGNGFFMVFAGFSIE